MSRLLFVGDSESEQTTTPGAAYGNGKITNQTLGTFINFGVAHKNLAEDIKHEG